MSAFDDRTNKLKECESELAQTKKYLLESTNLASLGSLVAGFTHELSTPVGLGITGMSDFVERTEKIKKLYEQKKMTQKDFENYLEKNQKIANLVFSNLKSASDLMLSFKRISVDQTSESKRKFNLHSYFNEIVATLYVKLKHRNILIQNQIDKEIELNSFAGLYSQIFTNLILNSSIHAFEKEKQGIITVVASQDTQSVTIVYKDNGKGMSPENLNKIFDPFFTTKADEGGSGLGTNIIYEIVNKRLMGKISAFSQMEEGLEFTIVLPLEVS